jgi:hypothetical protein
MFPQGTIDLKNMTIDSEKWPSVFPAGTYKTEINITQNEQHLLSFEFTSEVQSDLLDTFG